MWLKVLSVVAQVARATGFDRKVKNWVLRKLDKVENKAHEKLAKLENSIDELKDKLED